MRWKRSSFVRRKTILFIPVVNMEHLKPNICSSMIVKAKLVKIYCSRDLLPTEVGVHIIINVVMLQDYCSRHLKISSFLSVHDGGTGNRGTTAGWLVTCSAHLEDWPSGWVSDSSVYTGKFLSITIPFINKFIEIYFIDQKIVHLGDFYEWSVRKCLGCTPSPQSGRNIISSPTKHSPCSSPPTPLLPRLLPLSNNWFDFNSTSRWLAFIPRQVSFSFLSCELQCVSFNIVDTVILISQIRKLRFRKARKCI